MILNDRIRKDKTISHFEIVFSFCRGRRYSFNEIEAMKIQVLFNKLDSTHIPGNNFTDEVNTFSLLHKQFGSTSKDEILIN